MTFTILRSRPKLSFALGTLALAAVLLVIPVPYSRTVGYELAIDVEAGKDTAAKVERELARRLHSRDGQVVKRQGGYRVSVPWRGASQTAASATADAFVKSLAGRGITARASVTPVTARVTGNVYAMARDKVLRLDIDEEASADEIADSVRQQLDEAGISASVDVQEGEGVSVVTVQTDDPSVLYGLEVNGASWVEHLDVQLDEGETHEEVVRRLKERLEALGISADVQFVDGKLSVKVNGAPGSTQP